jgi:hypothetical protein
MYKIKLHYQSDVKGIYTKEEETATDFKQFERKKNRMLLRWLVILMPSLGIDQIKFLSDDLLINMIQQKLTIENTYKPGEQERKFELKYELDGSLENFINEALKKNEALKEIDQELNDRLKNNIFEYLSDYDEYKADDEANI